MKKQLRGLFCAAALAAVMALPARAAEQTHRAYLCGYPDGSIQPGAPVTRAQLACALVRLAEEPLPEPVCSHSPDCKDCPYPGHGFLCWGSGDDCMRTRVEKLNREEKAKYENQSGAL